MKASMLALLLLLLLVTGCRRGEKAPEKKTQPKPERSHVQTLVDGFTGKAAVEQGTKARAAIEQASEKHNQDLDAVMK